MLNNPYYTVTTTPDDSTKEHAIALGYAATLMRFSPLHRSYPIAYLATHIEPAIHHGFMKAYFNNGGELVAFVAWAFVAPDVEKKFMQTGRWDLHDSEWNEGKSLWIIDLIAPFGHIHSVMKDLRDNEFKHEPHLRYYRIKQKRAISKELSRNSPCHFFRTTQTRNNEMLS